MLVAILAVAARNGREMTENAKASVHSNPDRKIDLRNSQLTKIETFLVKTYYRTEVRTTLQLLYFQNRALDVNRNARMLKGKFGSSTIPRLVCLMYGNHKSQSARPR
jgi:hypothetical protein